MAVQVRIHAREIKLLLTKEMLKHPELIAKVVKDIALEKREKACLIAQGAYKGTVEAIGDVLTNPGIPDMTSAQVRSRPTTVPMAPAFEVNLTSGRDRVAAWKPLTEAYRFRRPRSKTIWRKNGARRGEVSLSTGYRTAKASFLSRLSLASFKSGRKQIRVWNTRGLAHRAEFSVLMPTLDLDLDKLVLYPLATGQVQAVSGVAGQRSGIYRMYWAEGYRPWIGRLSFKVGVEMRRRISRL
jgi:hypothetical protein